MERQKREQSSGQQVTDLLMRRTCAKLREESMTFSAALVGVAGTKVPRLIFGAKMQAITTCEPIIWVALFWKWYHKE